jgi:hypothetical protein
LTPRSTPRAGAFRAAAVLFAGVTVFIAVLFVRALGEREFRSGLMTYGIITAVASVGLWRQRRWGRSLALLFALANAGLGALALISVILARRGPLLGPVILLVASVAFGYVLSRPIFAVDDE